MAIGRTFQESLQKALRGLEVGINGLSSITSDSSTDGLINLRRELRVAGAERIRYVSDAMRFGLDIEEIYDLTRIDRWFLMQIQDLVQQESIVASSVLNELDARKIFKLKQKGFSDSRLAELLRISEQEFRTRRLELAGRLES